MFLGICMRILLEGEHHHSWSLFSFVKHIWSLRVLAALGLHNSSGYSMLLHDIVFVLDIQFSSHLYLLHLPQTCSGFMFYERSHIIMKSLVLFLYARQWAKVFASFTCVILSTSTALLSFSFHREENSSFKTWSHMSKITQLGCGEIRIGIPSCLRSQCTSPVFS